MSMTYEEAARILDPETSPDALLKYGGEEARLEACNEACRVAEKVLREPRTVRLDDTGVQAMALAAEVSELRQKLAAYKDLGPVDRLRELAQADREGRCVVTEFVPGNEVWVVERDEDGSAVDYSGMVFITSVNGIAILSPTINGCAELEFLLSDFVEETTMSGGGEFSGYPISDCYTTMEEAKAAFEEEA